MKVLFIGGTGVISSACSQLAVERGIELYLLSRGKSARPIPDGAHCLCGDIRDRASAEQALGDHRFDAVVEWVGFTPEHVEADLELFRGRTAQYVFISSATVYQRPPARLPLTESAPLDNSNWEYARAKIACEQQLMEAYRREQFPVTIVRPSHTYDRTFLPVHGGYTVIDRMRKGKKVVVPGDGTSLWCLTHHTDFAKGLVGLLGNSLTLGEAFHITTDEVLTWNQIYTLLARAAGVEAHFVHIPSDYIAALDPIWGASLLGDKSHSVFFDNTKIKRAVPDFAATVPFSRGAGEILAWFDGDPARQRVDAQFDGLLDRIIASYEAAWPTAKA